MKVSYFHDDIEYFIDRLDSVTRGKVMRLLEMLAIKEYKLSMPYSKKIDRGLYELRVKSLNNIRVFYTFHQNFAVLLHIVSKKTQKLAKHDISTAKERLKMLLRSR